MPKRTFALVALLLAGLASASCSRMPPPEAKPLPRLELSAQDRVLVLAAHPDDEVIACAGIIQKALAAKLPLRIVFLTHGDSNEWSFLVYRKRPVVMPKSVRAMGLVRHDEAVAADTLLGVRADQMTFLGYPDFRTQDIWCSHWRERPPAESLLTHVNAVPYADAFRPGAPYRGERFLSDLKAIMLTFKPTRVFVAHPSDRNPDHRALYLFTRVALWDLRDAVNPSVHPYLVHYRDWPSSPRNHAQTPLLPPAELADQCDWEVAPLAPEELTLKEDALRKHVSQFTVGSHYLLSFVRLNELFGDIPPVTLRSAASSSRNVLSVGGLGPDNPAELTDEQRVAFVGIVRRSVALEGDSLILSTTLSRPLGEAAGASIYVFGYRSDRPFSAMPKLHVKLGVIQHEVLDQARKLPADTVEVRRSLREIKVRIPLKALGDPERVLTSSRTDLASVALDWSSWTTIELPSPTS